MLSSSFLPPDAISAPFFKGHANNTKRSSASFVSGRRADVKKKYVCLKQKHSSGPSRCRSA